MDLSKDIMTGKSVSLAERDENTIATTSSSNAEQSTSVQKDEDSDASTVALSPESILPDRASDGEAENDDTNISDNTDNDERPVIRRGKKWRKQSPIKIVGTPISPLASPPRWMREDEFPPPPKKTAPSNEPWWKLCERDYQIEEEYRNESTKRGTHGCPLSIYNSTKDVEGPACLYCY